VSGAAGSAGAARSDFRKALLQRGDRQMSVPVDYRRP
jgi:hypothetical protein